MGREADVLISTKKGLGFGAKNYITAEELSEKGDIRKVIQEGEAIFIEVSKGKVTVNAPENIEGKAIRVEGGRENTDSLDVEILQIPAGSDVSARSQQGSLAKQGEGASDTLRVQLIGLQGGKLSVSQAYLHEGYDAQFVGIRDAKGDITIDKAEIDFKGIETLSREELETLRSSFNIRGGHGHENTMVLANLPALGVTLRPTGPEIPGLERRNDIEVIFKETVLGKFSGYKNIQTPGSDHAVQYDEKPEHGLNPQKSYSGELISK